MWGITGMDVTKRVGASSPMRQEARQRSFFRRGGGGGGGSGGGGGGGGGIGGFCSGLIKRPYCCSPLVALVLLWLIGFGIWNSGLFRSRNSSPSAPAIGEDDDPYASGQPGDDAWTAKSTKTSQPAITGTNPSLSDASDDDDDPWSSKNTNPGGSVTSPSLSNAGSESDYGDGLGGSEGSDAAGGVASGKDGNINAETPQPAAKTGWFSWLWGGGKKEKESTGTALDEEGEGGGTGTGGFRPGSGPGMGFGEAGEDEEDGDGGMGGTTGWGSKLAGSRPGGGRAGGFGGLPATGMEDDDEESGVTGVGGGRGSAKGGAFGTRDEGFGSRTGGRMGTFGGRGGAVQRKGSAFVRDGEDEEEDGEGGAGGGAFGGRLGSAGSGKMGRMGSAGGSGGWGGRGGGRRGGEDEEEEGEEGFGSAIGQMKGTVGGLGGRGGVRGGRGRASGDDEEEEEERSTRGGRTGRKKGNRGNDEDEEEEEEDGGEGNAEEEEDEEEEEESPRGGRKGRKRGVDEEEEEEEGEEGDEDESEEEEEEGGEEEEEEEDEEGGGRAKRKKKGGKKKKSGGKGKRARGGKDEVDDALEEFEQAAKEAEGLAARLGKKNPRKKAKGGVAAAEEEEEEEDDEEEAEEEEAGRGTGRVRQPGKVGKDAAKRKEEERVASMFYGTRAADEAPSVEDAQVEEEEEAPGEDDEGLLDFASLRIPGTGVRGTKVMEVERQLACVAREGQWALNSTPRWLPWDLNPLRVKEQPNYRTCDMLHAQREGGIYGLQAERIRQKYSRTSRRRGSAAPDWKVRREVLYEWRSSEAERCPFVRFDREGFCRTVRGRNVVLVGDAFSLDMHDAVLNHLVTAATKRDAGRLGDGWANVTEGACFEAGHQLCTDVPITPTSAALPSSTASGSYGKGPPDTTGATGGGDRLGVDEEGGSAISIAAVRGKERRRRGRRQGGASRGRVLLWESDGSEEEDEEEGAEGAEGGRGGGGGGVGGRVPQGSSNLGEEGNEEDEEGEGSGGGSSNGWSSGGASAGGGGSGSNLQLGSRSGSGSGLGSGRGVARDGEASSAGFNLRVVLNPFLTPDTGRPTRYNTRWLRRLRRWRTDILILSRTALFNDSECMLGPFLSFLECYVKVQEVRDTLEVVRELYPDMLVIWRNSPAGHPLYPPFPPSFLPCFAPFRTQCRGRDVAGGAGHPGGSKGDDLMLQEVRDTLEAVRELYPDMLVIWRNSPAGHPSCHRFTRPLKRRPKPLQLKGQLPATWTRHAEMNVAVRSLLKPPPHCAGTATTDACMAEWTAAATAALVAFSHPSPYHPSSPPTGVRSGVSRRPLDHWVSLLYNLLRLIDKHSQQPQQSGQRGQRGQRGLSPEPVRPGRLPVRPEEESEPGRPLVAGVAGAAGADAGDIDSAGAGGAAGGDGDGDGAGADGAAADGAAAAGAAAAGGGEGEGDSSREGEEKGGKGEGGAEDEGGAGIGGRQEAGESGAGEATGGVVEGGKEDVVAGSGEGREAGSGEAGKDAGAEAKESDGAVGPSEAGGLDTGDEGVREETGRKEVPEQGATEEGAAEKGGAGAETGAGEQRAVKVGTGAGGEEGGAVGVADEGVKEGGEAGDVKQTEGSGEEAGKAGQAGKETEQVGGGAESKDEGKTGDGAATAASATGGGDSGGAAAAGSGDSSSGDAQSFPPPDDATPAADATPAPQVKAPEPLAPCRNYSECIPGTAVRGTQAVEQTNREMACLAKEGRWIKFNTPRWQPWSKDPNRNPLAPHYGTCDILHRRNKGVFGKAAEDIRVSGTGDWNVRPELKHTWKASRFCPPLNGYNRDKFCRAMGRRNVVFVGDQSQLALHDVFINHVLTMKTAKDIGTAADAWEENEIPLCHRKPHVVCSDHVPGGFTFRVVHNNLLSPDSAGGGKFNQRWLRHLTEWNASIVVLNKGFEKRPTAKYLSTLRASLAKLREVAPDVLLVWRNTWRGHPDCGNATEPLKAVPHNETNESQWSYVVEQNEGAKAIVK
ncbi:unnamed protein product, partial [Closterium sp. NIES-54]